MRGVVIDDSKSTRRPMILATPKPSRDLASVIMWELRTPIPWQHVPSSTMRMMTAIHPNRAFLIRQLSKDQPFKSVFFSSRHTDSLASPWCFEIRFTVCKVSMCVMSAKCTNIIVVVLCATKLRLNLIRLLMQCKCASACQCHAYPYDNDFNNAQALQRNSSKIVNLLLSLKPSLEPIWHTWHAGLETGDGRGLNWPSILERTQCTQDSN